MKSHPVKPQHTQLKNDLAELLRKYTGDLDGKEVLAVAAQVVGMVIALQDRKTMTTDKAMQIVAANIEVGNAAGIEQITGGLRGNA